MSDSRDRPKTALQGPDKSSEQAIEDAVDAWLLKISKANLSREVRSRLGAKLVADALSDMFIELGEGMKKRKEEGS